MFYKKVEKTDENASLGFQKLVTTTENQVDSEVLFTYANLDTTTTPYANLFKSLRLPITNQERADFESSFNNTAAYSLYTKNIIVAEIPKGEYGELIDGKTFKMKFPVMLNGVATSTTVYGSYFGYDKNGKFNDKLNNDLCEKQSYVNNLSAAPSPNSNITFLYSNDIKKPIGSKTVVTVLPETTITLAAAYKQTNPYIFSVSGDTNDIILFEIKETTSQGDGEGDLTVTVQLGTGFAVQEIKKNEPTVITQEGITNASIRMFHNAFNPSSKTLKVKIYKVSIGNLFWNEWTTSNKFPKDEKDETTGKRYAFFSGYNLNFGSESKFVNNFDQPVGMLYNDKGLVVITDPTLVSGFRYSAGTSSGYNGITSGSTYSGDENFAKIYFTSSTLCQSQYKSVTSEFVQNIMCIAMPNEFFYTNNSTYPDSYDENVTNKPVFISSVGLYNKFGELIGIGKMSEPVKKEKESIVPFNVKLKL